MMLGPKFRPFAATSRLFSCMGRTDYLVAQQVLSLSRGRGVSWKASATAPSSSRGSRSSNFSSSRSRNSSKDSRDRSSRSWDSRERDSSSRGGRGSRGSSPRPQQEEQRHWQTSADRHDTERWDDYNDDNDRDSYSDRYDDRYDDGDRRYPERPSKAAYTDELFGEALYGVAPILAALKAGSRTPHILLMQEGLTPAQRKDAAALRDIQKLATDAGAAVRTVSKHQLNMLSGNRPHQGLILDASPLQWRPLDVFPAAEQLMQQQLDSQAAAEGGAAAAAAAGARHPVWLALDEVMDPQNLGAMIRSAYCLGVSGILACSKNCCPLTPVVSKASAGAAELMTLHSCRSMPRTLADAAEKGWAVVGAAAEGGAVPVNQFTVDRPTILVMGNEGYGLRATVKRCCTHLVQIEMTPAAAFGSRGQQLVDSLNVSVATGILLHQLIQTSAR